ncbi:MAG: hypothetical protein C5B51_11030 [Terriglobia bacterium]|nr:MAG: hypothetical protein C5B51_11030 [Terriglobia bacterium]
METASESAFTFRVEEDSNMLRRNVFRVALVAVCAAAPALAQNDGAAISLTAHPGWVQIPGALIRPDCVHEIPNGAQVTIDGDKVTGDIKLGGVRVAHYEPCAEAPVITRPRNGQNPKLVGVPGTGNGWVEAVQAPIPLSSGDNIDWIGGTWTVPSNPSAWGALNYIFNGIEPTTQNWILQPVLQWGSNGMFGGNYWVLASWMVSSGGYAFHSPPVTVYPGHSISGYTWITGVSGGTTNWEVYAYDGTSGAYSWITAWSSGMQWNWAYAGVLESYGITSCSQFPASGYNVFSNTAVYHGYPSYTYYPAGWYGAIYGYGGPSCGFSAFPWGSYQYLFY